MMVIAVIMTKTPDFGVRERLIDEYAFEMIDNRLKKLRKKLPDSVSNVVLSIHDIGRHTIAVGLFSSVTSDAHEAGLRKF